MYTRHVDGDETTIFQFSGPRCRAWCLKYRDKWENGWTPWFPTSCPPLSLKGEVEISRAEAMRETASDTPPPAEPSWPGHPHGPGAVDASIDWEKECRRLEARAEKAEAALKDAREVAERAEQRLIVIEDERDHAMDHASEFSERCLDSDNKLAKLRTAYDWLKVLCDRTCVPCKPQDAAVYVQWKEADRRVEE